jgi:hypothetical protein
MFLTDRLLDQFSDDEVTAVMAHEIAHRKKHHILLTLVSVVVVMVVAALVLALLAALSHGRAAGRLLVHLALQGVLDLIAQAGGGVVEAYPQDTKGKKTSASFLYNGTRTLFEKAGFSVERSEGTKNCVMRRTVAPG